MKDRLILAGDSIAKGIIFDSDRGRYVRANRDGFGEGIRSALNVEVEQIAKLGWSVSELKEALNERFNKIFAKGEARPDIVAIEVGGNDSDFDWERIADQPDFDHQPKTPLHSYIETLQGIVASVRGLGVKPVLINLPPIDADRYFKFFTKGSIEMGKSVLKWLGQVGRIYWWHERYNSALEYVAEITSTALINIRYALLRTSNYRDYICNDGIHPNEKGQELIFKAAVEYVGRHNPSLLAV